MNRDIFTSSFNSPRSRFTFITILLRVTTLEKSIQVHISCSGHKTKVCMNEFTKIPADPSSTRFSGGEHQIVRHAVENERRSERGPWIHMRALNLHTHITFSRATVGYSGSNFLHRPATASLAYIRANNTSDDSACDSTRALCSRGMAHITGADNWP